MGAGRYNITIEKGSTFNLPIIIEDNSGSRVDITGYTPYGHVRKSFTSKDLLVQFTATAITGSSGSFDMTLNPVQTAALPSLAGVYDIILSSSLETVRILEGTATITPQVTRL